MSTFITIVHIITCVLLVIVVLLQSGKDGGIGMVSGGSSQTVFGSSGGANFFTKFTSAVAAIFMITSLSLTIMKADKRSSVFETMKAPIAAPAVPAAATPESAPPSSAPAAQKNK